MTYSQRVYPEDDYPHQRLTGAVVTAAHEVHRALGYGFLEAVYRRALAVELRYMQFQIEQERRFDLSHRGEPIGCYPADLVVESSVIVEVKTGLLPDPIAPVQTLNYLRASRLVVGLIVHFGPGLKIRRLVHRALDPAGGTLTAL
jgi:GxxExxY protein